MTKLFRFLGNIGKIISVYFVLLLISLVAISFSSSFNPKYHQRCTLDASKYDFSFLSKYEEIDNYELYVTCNTLDVVIMTDIDDKEQCIALVVNLSYSMPKYKDLQVTIKSNFNVLYFKIVDSGVVLSI